MSTMPSTDDLTNVVQSLSATIIKSEETFKHIDMDEYEAEMFFKGLSDCKNFLATLNWLIKRRDL